MHLEKNIDTKIEEKNTLIEMKGKEKDGDIILLWHNLFFFAVVQIADQKQISMNQFSWAIYNACIHEMVMSFYICWHFAIYHLYQ